jgi:hypothetical protein
VPSGGFGALGTSTVNRYAYQVKGFLKVGFPVEQAINVEKAIAGYATAGSASSAWFGGWVRRAPSSRRGMRRHTKGQGLGILDCISSSSFEGSCDSGVGGGDGREEQKEGIAD